MALEPIPAVDREDERWMAAAECAALGLDLSRPTIDIGGLRNQGEGITLAFSPGEFSNRGFLYARRHDTGRYLVIDADTTRPAVDAARLATRDAIATPGGYRALAAELSRQPQFTARDAHRFWLDSVEADFAVQSVFEQTPSSSSGWTDLALGCTLAASIRSTAEQTYIDTLRGERREPVIVRLRLEARPDWEARLPVPSLRAVRLDVGYLHDLADQYGLQVIADPPTLDGTPRRSTTRTLAIDL